MASFIYNPCLRDTFRGRFDFEGGGFAVMLVTNAYRPDKASHARRSDVVGEASGLGYQPGGIAADVRISMIDDALVLSLGGFRIPAASVSARYAIYYVSRGGAAEDDELVALIDFGDDVTSTNGPYELSASSLRIQN